jgi:hypothetical protein
VLPLSTERTTSYQILPTHEWHFISSLVPRTFTTVEIKVMLEQMPRYYFILPEIEHPVVLKDIHPFK